MSDNKFKNKIKDLASKSKALENKKGEEQTKANIALRKGTKRPVDGKPWPVAK